MVNTQYNTQMMFYRNCTLKTYIIVLTPINSIKKEKDTPWNLSLKIAMVEESERNARGMRGRGSLLTREPDSRGQSVES